MGKRTKNRLLHGGIKMEKEIRPNHYKILDIEVFDIIREAGVLAEFSFGNILKYIYRFKFKNGVEDLYKVRTYISIIEKEKKPINIQNIKKFTDINNYAINMLFAKNVFLNINIRGVIGNLMDGNYTDAREYLEEIIKKELAEENKKWEDY